MLAMLLTYALTKGWSSLAVHYLLPWLVRISKSSLLEFSLTLDGQCAHNWCVLFFSVLPLKYVERARLHTRIQDRMFYVSPTQRPNDPVLPKGTSPFVDKWTSYLDNHKTL